MKKISKKTRILRNLGIAMSFVLMQMIGGCDGCGCSCVEADADAKVNVGSSSKAGRIVVELTNLQSLAPASGTKTITVSYSGNLKSGGSGTGDPAFETTRTYEISAGNVPSPTLERVNMKPGNWECVVKINSWRASCTGTVNVDAGTRFVFKYNQSGCSH